jgi:hypothetical protein
LCAIVLAMAVLATGCGGSDGDSESDRGEASPESKTGSPAPTSEETSEKSGGGGGNYCDLARASVAQLNEENLEAVMSPDLAVRQKWFDEQKKRNDELAKAAPAQIRGDLELMVDVTNELGNATFISRDPDATRAATNRLGSPEVSAAIERVGRYNENECGITLGTPSP